MSRRDRRDLHDIPDDGPPLDEGPPDEARDFKSEFKRRILDEVLTSISDRAKGKGKGPQRPEGIVTIAFTDIEDSTGLVTRLGDGPARALIRRHDDVLRKVVRDHGGIEVERAGDGYMLAFATASSAVQCAIDLQRAIAADPQLVEGGIRLRVGIETGEAIAEETGYFGRTVFAASRIAEQTDGGEIVVSQATHLVAGPDRFPFGDRGEHALKGLPGTHRLFGVAWR